MQACFLQCAGGAPPSWRSHADADIFGSLASARRCGGKSLQHRVPALNRSPVRERRMRFGFRAPRSGLRSLSPKFRHIGLQHATITAKMVAFVTGRVSCTFHICSLHQAVTLDAQDASMLRDRKTRCGHVSSYRSTEHTCSYCNCPHPWWR